MRLVICITLASAITFLVKPASAPAGPYTNDLSQCLVESTTTQDRTALVRWMVVALSLHPDIGDLVDVSKDEYEKANKSVADLFMRVLTVSCKQEAAKAIKYEGDIAVLSSFQIFGQVAAKELFSHPDVDAGMADLEKYIDLNKLRSILIQGN